MQDQSIAMLGNKTQSTYLGLGWFHSNMTDLGEALHMGKKLPEDISSWLFIAAKELKCQEKIVPISCIRHRAIF